MKNKYLKLSICILSFIVFIVMVILLLSDNVSSFDNTIYKYVTYYSNDIITKVFKLMTMLCSVWFICMALVVIILVCKDKKIKYGSILNVILCLVINFVTKLIFMRGRPVGINLITESGYSFPSGHSMMSMAFYGFFIYLILNKKWSLLKKLLLCIPLFLLILFIGISRIYLGVHYASDVLAGFSLASGYLMLYILFIYEKKIQSK